MKQQRKVSSYDIARHAGVSQTTVSFVLNGRSDMPLSAATREKVLASARELGYRPNRSARAIQSGRFGCVALLQVGSGTALSSDLREGILDSLLEHDIHLVLARLPDTAPVDERHIPSILREWFADGLLVDCSGMISEPVVRLIEESQIPAVWIGRQVEADCVFADGQAGAREAVERLLVLGHRRIAYVPGVLGIEHGGSASRMMGYQEAMQAAGLAPEVVSGEPGAMLDRPVQQRLTALVCDGDTAAVQVMFAAAGCGLTVPRDLSLICLHDQVNDQTGLRLDTMLFPTRAVGRASVEMLLARIEDSARAFPPSVFAATYAPGASVQALSA